MRPVERLRPRNVLQLVVGAGFVLVVGLIVLRANLEVVREGDLLGYGPVKEIELFGRYSLYKDAQPIGALDTLNAFALVSIASVTFFVAALLDAADRWFGFFSPRHAGRHFSPPTRRSVFTRASDSIFASSPTCQGSGTRMT